jgi:hypothetical protein
LPKYARALQLWIQGALGLDVTSYRIMNVPQQVCAHLTGVDMVMDVMKIQLSMYI